LAKKKPNLKRALRAKAKRQERITDLGEFDSEFLKRGEAFYAARHPEGDLSRVRAQASALVEKKQYEQAISLFGLAQDPREKAHVIALQGLATEDDDRARKYMRRAVEIDAANVDALAWRAMHTPVSVDRKVMWDIVVRAEEQLGPVLESRAGAPGTDVFAAPYLRTLYGMFDFFMEMQEHAQAVRVGEKLRSADAGMYVRIEMDHGWTYAWSGDVEGLRSVCSSLRDQEDTREGELLVLEMLTYYLAGDLERAAQWFDLVQEENDMIFSLASQRYELLPLDAETDYPVLFHEAVRVAEMLGTCTQLLSEGEGLGEWIGARMDALGETEPFGQVPLGARGEVFRELSDLTGSYCEAHLGEPFCLVLEEAARSLCHDPESGVERGKREAWAAGIVHAMARCNGLFSADAEHRITAGSIHSFFRVGASTMTNRSKQVAGLLNEDELLAYRPESEEPSAAPRVPKPVLYPRVLQLSVELNEVRPKIWRTLLVPATMRLKDFAEVLNTAMGWEGYHLHLFRKGRLQFGQPDPDFQDFGPPMGDESKTLLSGLLEQENDRLVYEYDFGDGWEHLVRVEKMIEDFDGQRLPVCLAGKRACPPEDCGGPWGYAELLENLRNPATPPGRRALDWLGGEFDPEAFSVSDVTRRLR
jgi:hypothetical protein